MELHKDEFDILAVIKFLSWGLKDLLEQKEIVFNMNIDDLASKLLTSHKVIGDKQRVVQTLGEWGVCGRVCGGCIWDVWRWRRRWLGGGERLLGGGR